MDVEGELTERFYNLPGVTVGDKKRNFNAFVNELDNKITQENLRIEFVKNLESRNKLDSSFQLQLLLHYGAHQEILEVLKSGNSYHIGKILKHWDFFRKTLQSTSADTFVNEILPQVSCSTRMKLINRLSKNLFNEKMANEYFKAIENKYGIVSAEIMLPYCTVDVIETKIEKYNLILSRRQWIVVLKRNIEFFDYYFKYLQKNPNIKHNDYLLKMILKNDKELFRKLAKKHNYSIRMNLGKRLSKKILQNSEDIFIELNDDNITFANRSIYQQLRKKPELFQQFIMAQITEEKEDFFSKYRSSYTRTGKFGSYVSKGRRYKFLNDIFKQKFNDNLHDNLKYISEDLLLLMPDSIRHNVLMTETKVQQNFIYLCPLNISVPYIMEKLKHCSQMNKRVMYIELLYKTCKFNKDSTYLLELLEHVQNRYRNDVKCLRAFFYQLWSWPEIELLSAEHWQHIDTIQKLLSLQNISTKDIYSLEKRIGYLLNNDSDITEQMQTYVEILKDNRNHSVFAAIPRYRKVCILELKKYIDKIEDQTVLNNMLAKYLNFIHNYNKSVQSDQTISILNFLPLIKSLLNEHLYALQDIITFYVRLHYTDFNPIIWQYPEWFFTDRSLFSWYLLHNTDEVLNKLDTLLRISHIRKDTKFIRQLSLYSFRDIPENVTTYCNHTIKEGTVLPFKLDALSILIQINENEFLNTAALFAPMDDGKINIEDSAEKVSLQREILANLKNICNPRDALELLKRFCKGDYLKFTLRPLYSVIIHIPEKNAIQFLATLHEMAVSVRKHAIHISKIILPIKDFCNFVRTQTVKEKNPSLKTILFKKTLEYAYMMRGPEFWELLQVTMHGINKFDVEAHDLLLKISSVPQQYMAAFITEAYKQLSSNPEQKIWNKKYEIIRNTPIEVIDQLNYHLLETFLSEIMFTQCYAQYPQCWINILFYSQGEKQNNLYNFALKKFEEYNSTKYHPDAREEHFMGYLCKSFLKFHVEYSMVHKFSITWRRKFAPELDIRREIFIDFVLAYAEVGYNTEAFAKKAMELLARFLDNCDRCLFEFFAKELENFFSNIDKVDIVQFITLFSEFSEKSLTIPVSLISIRLLRKYMVNESKEKYTSLLNKFKDQSDINLKIYCREYYPEYFVKPE